MCQMTSKWIVSGTFSCGKPKRPETGGANPSNLKIYLVYPPVDLTNIAMEASPFVDHDVKIHGCP